MAVSPEPITQATIVGEILGRAARAVRAIPDLGKHQAVDLNYAPWDEDEPISIDVFGCQPDQLEAYLVRWPEAEPNHDLDELLQRVNVVLDGVPCTFFRRG